ncbi:hypothetical protein OKW12_001129 [Pseudomonas silensiensis]|nr:hypothetical protein [Pseudomonas silensiensis]
MQINQVVEYLLADVRDHTFADPRHQIEARKGADRQPDHQHHEQADGLVEQMRRLGHEPLIHQQANALPHRQGDAGGDDQREQCAKGRPAIRCKKAAGQANRAAVTGREHRVIQYANDGTSYTA